MKGAGPGAHLVVAGAPAIAWHTVLGAAAWALGITGLIALLPPGRGGIFPVLAVVVVAAGTAVVSDDPTASLSATVPVRVRRQVLARLVLVLPVSAASMAMVAGAAWLLDAAPGRGLVVLWAALTAVSLAVAAAAARAAGVPGVVAAVGVLGAGLVLAWVLPSAVQDLPLWDSGAERLALALLVSAGVLAWATRDPGA